MAEYESRGYPACRKWPSGSVAGRPAWLGSVCVFQVNSQPVQILPRIWDVDGLLDSLDVLEPIQGIPDCSLGKSRLLYDILLCETAIVFEHFENQFCTRGKLCQRIL